jgi:secondary thiamine-phosphate synthase enzyme
MDWFQKTIIISPQKRGFLLITDEIINQILEISEFKVGILHLFIKHTSASLTINENADPTVREDLETHFNHTVLENAPYYKHTMEGPDDMPAHIKFTLIGNNLTIPISEGLLNLGIWQGIYLCEHRNHPHSRKIIATINGIKI